MIDITETPLVKELRDQAARETKTSESPFKARMQRVEWLAAAEIERLQSLAAPVPPADGALGRAWEALARLRTMTPAEFKAYHSCVDLFETALRALPSGAGAAEPGYRPARFPFTEHDSIEVRERGLNSNRAID